VPVTECSALRVHRRRRRRRRRRHRRSSTVPSRAVSPEEIFIEEGTSGNLRAIRGFP